MIEIKGEKLNKWLDAVQRRYDARIRDITAITDREVMERLGVEEDENPKEDVLYSRLCEQQGSAFYTLTGFTKDEFDKLFLHVEDALTNTGRGRKGKISPRDILLMILHYFRRYPRIEEASGVFKIKPSTFQGLLSRYIPILADILKKIFIDQVSTADLPYDQDFPDCRYVVDATVQQISKPFKDFDKAKEYFSGKHYLYCLKSQVIVNIKGLALHIATGFKGSIHDKKLFDLKLPEFEAIINKHPDEPKKILADKGYQEPNSQILVTPFKGSTTDLTRDQLQFNQKLGSVRIIIENFFGRLKSRYEIMSNKYRGSHESYEDIFTICCALVNFEQIEIDHPLRSSDGSFYQKLEASLMIKKEEKIAKEREKRRQQARHRRKIFSIIGDSDEYDNSSE